MVTPSLTRFLLPEFSEFRTLADCQYIQGLRGTLMDQATLLELTAEIVAAHVSNNSVATGDVATLIASVHKALTDTGTPAPAAEAPKSPAVSIRASVKADRLTCLECGFTGKMLKRHLGIVHNQTPAEYRAAWKLPADYPMVASDYAAKRADLARSIGLGRKRAPTATAVPAAPAKAARKTASAKKARAPRKARAKALVAEE